MKQFFRVSLWQVISYSVLLQTVVTVIVGQMILQRKFASLKEIMDVSTAEIDVSGVRKVLIVRLDEIGDMVMFSPFLRALRRRLPEAHITLIVKPGVQNLVARCPYVNEVLVFDQSGNRAERFLRLPWRAMIFASRYLRHRSYDLALLPRWDTDYYYAAFIAFWSGAPLRLGYSETTTDYKRQVNRGFDRLLTHCLMDRSLKHDVEHNMTMIRFLGGDADDDRQEIWLDENDEAFADVLLDGLGSSEILIGLGPSGGHSVLKQWPLEYFVELGCHLHQKHGARLLFVGGPGDEEMGKKLAHSIGASAIDLTGKMTLRQMAAVIKRCRVYVGNDSGPTHVAAAMGVPTVAIFGSSCPHRFHPGEHTALLWLDLPCGPCQSTDHTLNRCKSCIYDRPRCLIEITPEIVEQAVMESLSKPLVRLPLTATGVGFWKQLDVLTFSETAHD